MIEKLTANEVGRFARVKLDSNFGRDPIVDGIIVQLGRDNRSCLFLMEGENFPQYVHISLIIEIGNMFTSVESGLSEREKDGKNRSA